MKAIYLSIYPFILPSVDLSFHPAMNLSIYQSIHPIYLLSIYLSNSLSIYLSIYLSNSLSISLYGTYLKQSCILHPNVDVTSRNSTFLRLTSQITQHLRYQLPGTQWFRGNDLKQTGITNGDNWSNENLGPNALFKG